MTITVMGAVLVASAVVLAGTVTLVCIFKKDVTKVEVKLPGMIRMTIKKEEGKKKKKK